MTEQKANHKSKAVLLILLMLSGGLVAPLSGGNQPNRYLSSSGSEIGDQFLKTLSSELVSSQNEPGLYLFHSNGQFGSAAGWVPISSNQIDSQVMKEVSSDISSRQPINLPDTAVLVLRDGQTGQNLVLLINLGQSAESSRVSPLPLLFAPLLQVWLDSERRRSRFRIYVEILDLLKRGTMTPYEVAFHLRLNRKKTREYLEFLKNNSFLESREIDGRATYSITSVGRTFVENLKSVLEADRR